MGAEVGLMLAGLVAILALVLLLVLVRIIRRRSREVASTPALWEGRDYRCPGCRGSLEAGWVMLGRGAIWRDRAEGPPGAFSTIAGALPNTISLSLRPAANQAWRCPRCQLLLVDHSRLVRPGGSR
jgi:hypothetical protein